jgi:ubiquinone biosynthesis protein
LSPDHGLDRAKASSESTRPVVPSPNPDEVPGSVELTLRALGIAATAIGSLVMTVLVAAPIALLDGRLAAKRFLSRRLVALLQRLGPAFVKAGQVLGTRRDVVPRVLCDELAILQDDCVPLSPAQARAALDALYDTGLDAVFRQFDDRPVASGSMACVYRAQLCNGADVAVKLQRPGIRHVMAADLTLIRKAGGLAARLPMLRGVPVGDVLDHLCTAIYGQLDFEREAANLKRLRINLSSVPRVWVPRVEDDASCDRAVVMEFVPGLDVTMPERCSPAVRKWLAGGTLAAVYQMLFVDGFVHCDLHPGNLYFTQRGQIVVLDAGFNVQLSERMRRLFGEFFMNMSLDRGHRCAEIVVESSEGARDGTDREGFIQHMAELVHRNAGVPAKEFSLIAFATEMFDLQRRFGLHAAPELVFPLLSLLVIEGTVRDLDPEVDFQGAARPILTRGIFGIARPRPASMESTA